MKPLPIKGEKVFDTTKEDLKDILRKLDEGKLQLPDFQRDYVWGDEDVRSLIASIAKGFPVGALLTLETGGEVRFKPRLIEGVPARAVDPAELLLDGQQRMTSLYQSLMSPLPVRTISPKRKEVERYYYLDIHLIVSGAANVEDAIIGVPADKVIRTNFGRDIVLDLSSREKEFENDHFPLNTVFDSRDWFYEWRDYWKKKDRDIADLDRAFVKSAVESIERYKMPIIRLDKTNSREAVCLVFEKVNVGGKKLDAFELVTAVYAADEFNLRDDWTGVSGSPQGGRRHRILGHPNRRDVLAELASTDFLQACTLLHTREQRLLREEQGYKDKELPQISCKREALLELPLAAYRKYADPLEEGFIEAGAFLNALKIIWHKDVPYPPQIVALASAFAILGDAGTTAAAKQKLEQWFWCVVLGELYGSSTESRLARDVPELVYWILGQGNRPRSIDEALFQRERLRSLRIRLSAAYKGIHALTMKHGCRDFITGRGADIMTFFNDKIDIHHIFPRAWCLKNGIAPAVFNSIVNKAPLSKRSNIIIGGHAPSVYLQKIETAQGISSEQLDDILRSHLIEPSYLRSDDFDGFFRDRMAKLVALVSQAMDKPVVESGGANEPEIDVEDTDSDEDEDIEEVA